MLKDEKVQIKIKTTQGELDVKKYNNLYSEEKLPDSKPPYNWSGSLSYGLFSEKIPIGLFNGSLFLMTRCFGNVI